MHLPDGKLPGYYAQIVKGIADKVSLFDRYRELLVLEKEQDMAPVLELLRHYNATWDECELILLPELGVEPGGLYADYIFETRSGRLFADMALTSAFRLTKTKPEAEYAPALQQLEEHLIATVQENETWYLIDRQLSELADRIAVAYNCGTAWWQPSPNG
jgi:hypothetical protein